MEIGSSAVLALLEASPQRIAAAICDSSNANLRWKPAPDSWSIHEVLAHLRACADVWGAAMREILDEHSPTFRYVSPRGYLRKTDYLDLEFAASFRAFRKQREELLDVLRSLSQDAWSRRALVKATQVREETVLSYAQRLAVHEAGHGDQIDRILEASRPLRVSNAAPSSYSPPRSPPRPKP